MPWTETVIMQRLEFIRAIQNSGESFSAVCRQFKISRKTGYKWLNRFQLDDPLSLQDRSRARLTHASCIPDEIIQLLIDMRRKHPDWGPVKIRDWLLNKDVPFNVPASSSIGDILKKENLVTPIKRRQRAPDNLQPLTEICQVNQVWSADFKGKFKLRNQSYCCPFTLTDNHSRYLLACEANDNENGSFVKLCFEKAFREYGLPDVIRTDNGRPFAGNGVAGLSYLSVWWIKLGILPERIQKGYPGQNGRHERMHRSLKAGMKHGHIYRTLEEQQVWFNHYRHEFNFERPHNVHHGKTPSSQWIPSIKQWDGVVREVEYPKDAHLYRVHAKGNISAGSRLLFLSESLRGEYVMMKEVDDGLHVILFDRLILAYYDSIEGQILRID